MRYKTFIILITLYLLSSGATRAFDASPFNTQSADISEMSYWTIYYDSAFANNSRSIAAPFGEVRVTFFDKLRLGVLGALVYAKDGTSSAYGFNNLILTTELETYDTDKHDFLKINNFELIDHAAWFFNQFIPTAHNSLLDSQEYNFNTGMEWQRTLTKYMGLYSEVGYAFNPQPGEAVDHGLVYNNSISFEIHHWIQPYIELLGRTSFNRGATSLALAPGISFYHGDNYYSYFNPIIGLKDAGFDWGFQVGLTGVF